MPDQFAEKVGIQISRYSFGRMPTCLPDGEGKWHPAFTEPFRDKLVRVVIDRDQKGEDHGNVVGAALSALPAR